MFICKCILYVTFLYLSCCGHSPEMKINLSTEYVLAKLGPAVRLSSGHMKQFSLHIAFMPQVGWRVVKIYE